ncbi:MAG: hypothetical protein ACUVSK_13030 [Desulfotomaculales bacterium]
MKERPGYWKYLAARLFLAAALAAGAAHLNPAGKTENPYFCTGNAVIAVNDGVPWHPRITAGRMFLITALFEESR